MLERFAVAALLRADARRCCCFAIDVLLLTIGLSVALCTSSLDGCMVFSAVAPWSCCVFVVAGIVPVRLTVAALVRADARRCCCFAIGVLLLAIGLSVALCVSPFDGCTIFSAIASRSCCVFAAIGTVPVRLAIAILEDVRRCCRFAALRTTTGLSIALCVSSLDGCMVLSVVTSCSCCVPIATCTVPVRLAAVALVRADVLRCCCFEIDALPAVIGLPVAAGAPLFDDWAVLWVEFPWFSVSVVTAIFPEWFTVAVPTPVIARCCRLV